MTSENEKRVKDRYNNLIREKEKLNQKQEMLKTLRDQKTQLEQDPHVQDYLKVLEEMDKIINYISSTRSYSNQEILNSAANEIYYEENTNNIYIYMGTYDYDSADIIHGSSVIELGDNAPDFYWKEYKNIELRYNEATKQVLKRELQEFKEESTILYAPKGMEPKIFYNQVRKIFFENLIEFDQEEAVKRVISEFAPMTLQKRKGK